MQLTRARRITATITALLAVVMLAACSSPAPKERTITLTFIRHGESQGNADGVADTAVPGPSLTPAGEQQAAAVASRLQGNRYDGIYASEMVRTQQTAAPMSKALGEPVNVLPGLNEINAGWFDGGPVKSIASTFLVAPMNWLQGDRNFAIPGSVNGNQFNSSSPVRCSASTRAATPSRSRSPAPSPSTSPTSVD